MTDELDYSKPIYSKAIIDFITVANEYCLFFEKVDKYSADDILQYFQKIAPLLYLKASILPFVDVTDESFNERFVTEEQWEEIFKALRTKFGPIDVYHTLNITNDSEESSLSDNMADIYQDLKDFVMLYQKPFEYSKENAVSEVRRLFHQHWGIRVVNALKTIHFTLYRNEIDQDLSDLE
ncbi:MAG: DUF5063 domain-containing protein [Bacteroidetes bacterium]|nr:DUF5063 domain-containing protein [Bacteroidota bacterium]